MSHRSPSHAAAWQVDIGEFLAYFGVRSDFVRKAFGLLDMDGDGQIDLREFVIGLCVAARTYHTCPLPRFLAARRKEGRSNHGDLWRGC